MTRPLTETLAYHNALLYVYETSPPVARQAVLIGLSENTDSLLTCPIEKEDVVAISRFENFDENTLGKMLGGWLSVKVAGEIEQEESFAKGKLQSWLEATDRRIQNEQAYWRVYDGIDRILQGQAYLSGEQRRKNGPILDDNTLDAIATAMAPGVSYESLNLICQAVQRERINTPEVVERFVERVENVIRQNGVVGDRNGMETPFLLRGLQEYRLEQETRHYASIAPTAEQPVEPLTPTYVEGVYSMSM